MDANYDLTLKLLVVGDSSVGKTNFVMRLINNEFSKNYMTTSGIDLKTTDIEIKNKKIHIQLWDTAGQEKYKAITKNLFLKVMGALIIYDITNETSYNNLKSWVKLIKEECGKHMQLIILGNKSDLDAQRKISKDEAINYAKEQKIDYIETSSKTGENVKKAVTMICENILENKELNDSSSFVLDNSSFLTDKRKKRCCK